MIYDINYILNMNFCENITINNTKFTWYKSFNHEQFVIPGRLSNASTASSRMSNTSKMSKTSRLGRPAFR